MKIHHAEFVASAFTLQQLIVDRLPQICMVGSSNVGKSTLINQLGRSPKLALTSSTPGKTASVNFYRFNQAFYLVDLPGYGYAKVSHKTKKGWSELIEGYISDNDKLRAGVLIVDLRHPAKPDDLGFFEWANEVGLPVVVVANKADKLTRSEQITNTQRLAEDLGLPTDDIIVFSAEKGLGKEALLRAIESHLADSGQAADEPAAIEPADAAEASDEYDGVF